MKNEKYDFLTFLEGDKKGQIEVIGTTYNDPGEPLDKGIMGDSYHIVLFREDKNKPEDYTDPDSFDAVLVEPFEYISRLITEGWYGIIARKTTTSRPLIDKMLDKFNEAV